MSKTAVQMRYLEFVRRTGRIESSDSVREFLHLEIMRILSARNSCDLVLHGGCKTRYIDGSQRYSMDMDFSMNGMLENSLEQKEQMIHNAIDPLLRELVNTGITLQLFRERWHNQATGLKLCFKANQLKELFPRLFVDHPGDINFNIEIDALLPEEHVRVASTIPDRSLNILVLEDKTHMARKASAVLLRNQLRALYDLDLYINRKTHYDLNVVRRRMNMPALTHEELVEQLCRRIDQLDIPTRAHQLHLPDKAELASFLIVSDRIKAIRTMCPGEYE